MTADPVEVARALAGAGDHQVGVGPEARDGEVALVAALLVQHAGVDDAAGRHADVVRAQSLERGLGVRSFDLQLAERGLVEQGHRLAGRPVLGPHVGEPVLAAEGVDRLRLHALRREPVHALPAHLGPEGGAAGPQPLVERRAAQSAPAGELPVRERDVIVHAHHLADPLAQEPGVGVERGEAAGVGRPEIHRRPVLDDPLGERASRPARRRDAARAEAGAHVVATHLRRFTQDEVVVGRERLRPVEEPPHLRMLEHGQALHRVRHQDLELLPVVLERLEDERVRDALGAPRLRPRVEAAHEEAAHFLLHVDVPVGIAQHRQVRRDARDRLGHDVHVLAGVERDRHPAHPAQLARPHARAVDEDARRDRPLGGLDARHRATLDAHPGHLHALAELGTARAGAAGEGLGHVGGIGLAVPRDPHRADQIVGAHVGVAAPGLLARDHVRLDAVGVGHRRVPAQLDHPLRGPRHAHAAALLPAGGLAGLGLEPAVEIDAVPDETGEVARRAELAHQPGRVPGGAAGETPLLQQHHVLPAELRQVIRDAGADDPAADDDDARAIGHGSTVYFFRLFSCGGPEMAPALPQWRTTGWGGRPFTSSNLSSAGAQK